MNTFVTIFLIVLGIVMTATTVAMFVISWLIVLDITAQSRARKKKETLV
jgi:phage shock protein PspC (stress-responsive transcriptional regulator)